MEYFDRKIKEAVTCFFCENTFFNNSAYSSTGKGAVEGIDCYLCRLPVCSDCSRTISEEITEDFYKKYRVCPNCMEKSLKIYNAENLINFGQGSLKCYVCGKNAEFPQVNCSSCKIPLCLDCGIKIADTLVCRRCRDKAEKNIFKCSICNKAKTTVNTKTFKCPVCFITVCESHKVFRKFNSITQGVCSACVSKTKPLIKAKPLPKIVSAAINAEVDDKTKRDEYLGYLGCLGYIGSIFIIYFLGDIVNFIKNFFK